MNRLKLFGRVFVKSISNISYYQDIYKAKFSFSLKYLSFLLYVLYFFGAIILAIKLTSYFSQIPQFKEDVASKMSALYPEELVLTVDNGQIYTNVKEPYFIGDYLVIDTQSGVGDFSDYKDKVVIGSNFAVVPDDQSREAYRVVSLSEYLEKVPNGSKFNQEEYLILVSKLLPYLNYAPALLLLAIVLLIIFGPIFAVGGILMVRMMVLVFSSLLLLLLAKIMKRDLSYQKIYQLSLHALTVPVILSFITNYFKFPMGYINTLIFLVYMVVVIASWEVKKSTVLDI